MNRFLKFFKNSFIPKPKVDSAVLKLDFIDNNPESEDLPHAYNNRGLIYKDQNDYKNAEEFLNCVFSTNKTQLLSYYRQMGYLSIDSEKYYKKRNKIRKYYKKLKYQK